MIDLYDIARLKQGSMIKKKTTIEKDFFEEIKCKKSLIKKYYNI